MSSTDYDRARTERRRRLQQRQTVVFGTIILLLAALLVIAWLMWIRVIPSPFTRDFTEEQTATTNYPVACPAPGAVSVPLGQITAVVLNSTDRGGLATSVATQLADVGVGVPASGNYPEPIAGVGLIIAGPDGLDEAYTLAQLFPGITVTQDGRADSGVHLIIGNDFQAMGDPTLLVAGQPLPVPAECSAPAATATPTA